MVHSVLVDTSTSSAADSFHIPPLVVKVCVPGQTSDILNEAACYDEMEVLQGVCIPRCYGLFQTNYVSDELDFPIMAERKARDEKLRREAEEDLDEDESLEPVVYDDLVTVLLMERVGDRLKLGSPLPHGVRCVFHIPHTSDLFCRSEDITDMYNDIGRLFLCHHDIRYSNFLSALPEDQGGLPSLPSPFTGRTYSWRVVDFDLMKKTPLPKVAFRAYHFSYIYRVLHNVPYGCIVEPWE
ncbi:hypothetical protein ARMGADRAFT_690234 [Armillaria gallica]|uniref:Protein kinase domain-containing protein n=1 Tax=Armillaria gallica TaxID=47427 RepID=A0A2H3CM02_ARMGA|nr:hypothetical protein ARMGADRAFT_690234 [Armillaria gallica]